jgi:hypothetical protein
MSTKLTIQLLIDKGDDVIERTIASKYVDKKYTLTAMVSLPINEVSYRVDIGDRKYLFNNLQDAIDRYNQEDV